MGQWTAREMNRLWAYDEFVAGVYEDRRLTGPIRDLILLMGWMLWRDPTAPNGDYQGRWWHRVQELTERDAVAGRRRADRSWPGFQQVIADDLPAYYGARFSEYAGRCEGPRLRPYQPRPPAGRCVIPVHPHSGDCQIPDRPPSKSWSDWAEKEIAARDGVCGEPTNAVPVVERDQVTGQDRLHWFCRRHEVAATQLRLDLEVPNRSAPEPVPNRGGLLPCYLQYQDDPLGTRWIEVYRWASGRRDWVPPVWGVKADDWPAPEEAERLEPPPARPTLVVLPGGLLDAVAGREE